MRDPLDTLERALRGLPTEQVEVLVPFLALAFELYVPGVLVPDRLRAAISALLDSLGPTAGVAYPEARLALLRRFEAAGLPLRRLQALAPVSPQAPDVSPAGATFDAHPRG